MYHHATSTAWSEKKRTVTKSVPMQITSNQHLPCHQFPILLLALLVLSTLSFTVPNDELKPILTLYFHLGMSNTATSVMDHLDPAHYGMKFDPYHIITFQHKF
jgi:hypothetical protein